MAGGAYSHLWDKSPPSPHPSLRLVRHIRPASSPCLSQSPLSRKAPLSSLLQEECLSTLWPERPQLLLLGASVSSSKKGDKNTHIVEFMSREVMDEQCTAEADSEG